VGIAELTKSAFWNGAALETVQKPGVSQHEGYGFGDGTADALWNGMDKMLNFKLAKPVFQAALGIKRRALILPKAPLNFSPPG